MAIIVQRTWTNSIGGLGNSWNSIFDHNKTAKQTVALIACLLSFFHSNTFEYIRFQHVVNTERYAVHTVTVARTQTISESVLLYPA